MSKFQKIAFIFPGQGSQYPGMGKDFIEHFSVAKLLFEEANDLLKRNITDIVIHGPEASLTETRNSQTGIFLVSMALLKVINQSLPALKPYASAGLSLGEYSALTAAKALSFQEALPLVEKRGQFMNEACLAIKGTMAVIMGLDYAQVEDLIKEANCPNDLWAANFNCPGQVVISGTLKGVTEGSRLAKEKGAKRVLPLQVHGAFHSGLMRSAEEKLQEALQPIHFKKTDIRLAMNVSGGFVNDPEAMRQALAKQVTSPVRWEQSIRALSESGVDLFIEIGPGKTLAGLNKRIGTVAETISIEKVEDLDLLAKEIA